jgi:uncharacterized repeat protein (TIGR03803 family)
VAKLSCRIRLKDQCGENCGLSALRWRPAEGGPNNQFDLPRSPINQVPAQNFTTEEKEEFMTQPTILGANPYRVLTIAVVILSAVVASVSLQAQTYSVLYNFSPGTKSGDPSNPQSTGQITQGRDGNLWTTTPDGGSFGGGAAINITPSGALVVFSFNNPPGVLPFGGLTLGTDGNFYGTTESGGTIGQGTLFKLTSTGSLTTLYNFGTCKSPCKEGLFPRTPPVEGSDGNFYGTTFDTNDGTNDGVVYKLTSAGKFSTIYAFAFGGTQGFNPQAPLIQGADGNLYGTAASGGITTSPTNCWGSSSSCGTVFKVTTGGKLTTIYKFDQTHGAGPLSPVIQGTDGNFYGTTSAGGTSGLGVVFKLTSAGVITVLHNFIGSDGETPLAGLVQANDGNFYGVASAGGSLGFGTIFKVTSTSDHTFSVVFDFDQTRGQTPEVALFQNTNGILYGDTFKGGADGAGVFYSLNISAAQFASLQNRSGKVGSTVSILGQGFTGSTAVTFGGVNATTFTVVSDNYMTANVPTGGKTGTVTVVRPSGSLNSIQQFKVTPTVASFSPPSGPIGTSVTINGTGLTQTTKVTFGGVKATTLTVNSDSQVTATVPSAAKTGKITVTTTGGSATSSGTFSVTPTILSFSPPSGKVGTVVTMNGTGLTQTTGVTFGGVAAARFAVVSDLQITATVPTGAITGKIAVTTTGGTATSSANFTVTP